MSTVTRSLRAAGLLSGIALAALVLFVVRVPDSGGALGAGLRLSAVAPGDLTISDGPVLAARNMVPAGRTARGRVRLRNIGAGPLRARLRVRPAGRLLDRALNLRLTAGGRTLAVGSLGSLRRWSRPVLVPYSRALTVRAFAWVPSSAEGYRGRFAEAELEIRTRLVERAR